MTQVFDDASPFVYGTQSFLFGADSAGGRLATELSRLGAKNVAILSGRSAAKAGLASALSSTALSGVNVVATFEDIASDAMESDMEELAARLIGRDVDAVVAIGGGGVIDTAKGVVLLLTRGGHIADFYVGPGQWAQSADAVPPVLVAVPTTLSGAETTSSAGVHSQLGQKHIIRASELIASVVCADPEYLATTPDAVLVSTGMCALAHCVEATYSKVRNPFSTALALGAAELLTKGLYALSDSRTPRTTATTMLGGASVMAALALSRVRSGLQHAICHVLGGEFGTPHGVAHSIMLPAVMRYNLTHSALEQALFADVLGWTAGDKNADAPAVVEGIRAKLNGPSRLRDVGIAESDLAGCAEHVLAHPGIADNPRPVHGSEDILDVLHAAW